MLKLHSCTHGHFWEASEDTAAARCPECGAPTDALPFFDLAPVEQTPTPVPEAAEVPLVDEDGLPVVAGYQVVEALGKGPTGIRLYRAKQPLVTREVLLEVVLAREDSTQRAWSSLRSEAGALGKLSHPNIVAIHDAGERDRQLFYNGVDFIDGPTLDQKVADTPLPFPQVLRLMELLARAIGHASERGVLHRHLEPAKVLLQPVAAPGKGWEEGMAGAGCLLHTACYIPRITGFGLARRPVEGDSIDADLLADAGFLAPEQAWGRTKEYGPHTDVYALGGILYFLLTGRPPFRGPTLGDIIDAIQTAELRSPSSFRRVPGDLEAICKKCLTRQPRRRYRHAGELADDLRAAALRYPIGARPATGWTHTARWGRRHPAAAALLVVILLAPIGTLIGYGIGASKGELSGMPLRQAHNEIASLRHHNQTLQQQVSGLRGRQRLIDYKQKLGQVVEAIDKGRNVDLARQLLDSCSLDERRFEWHYLMQKVQDARPIQLAGAEDQLRVALHPTGQFLAIARQVGDRKEPRSQVKVWHLPSGAWTGVEVKEDGVVRGLCFSPDGQSLAVGGDRGGVVIHRLSEDLRRIEGNVPCPDVEGEVTALAFSPDGRRLTAALSRGVLFNLDVASGRRLPIMYQPPGGFDAVRGRRTEVLYRRDGTGVVSFTAGSAQVYAWRTDAPIGSLLVLDHRNVLAMAFSARDNLLAVARSDGTIRLNDAYNGNEQAKLEHFPSMVRYLAFSSDGERLAVACADGKVRIWARGGGAWVELLEVSTSGAAGVVFGPDGRSLVAAGPKDTVVLGVLP